MPHGCFQFVGTHRAIATKRLAAKLVSVGACAAIITVIGWLASADHTARHLAIKRVAALPADHQTLQQPARPTTPVALSLAILVQLLLNRLEYVRVNDCGHGDSDPLLAGNRGMRAVAVARGLTTTTDGTQAHTHSWDRPSAPKHGGSSIRRIAEHPVDGGRVPVLQSSSGHATHALQPAASLAQADPLNADPGKHLPNDLSLVLDDLELSGSAAAVPVDVAVAERRATHGAGGTGARRVASPTPASLQNAGPFVFGDHALNLQQQIVFSRAANRPIKEYDFNAGPAKLLNQQHLIGIPSSQPIGSVHIDPIDLATRHGIAQALQRWPSQVGAAAALVDVGVMRLDSDRVGAGPLMQRCELACDRVSARLSVSRHASVKPGCDATHAQSSATAMMWQPDRATAG
jgi:hypothetical protein